LPHTFDGTMVRWDNPAMNQDELWQVDLVVGTAVTLPDTLLVNEHYGVRSDDVLTTAVGQPVTTTIHAIPVSHTLTISKTAVPQTIRTGDRLTYTLSVQHLHPHLPTTNVVLTDVLPANTFFITATMPYTFDGTMVRWDVSTIAAGDTWEVMLIVGTTPTYTTGLVENVAYGVRSDDVLTVMGTAVTVPILPTHQVYLPFILQE
ncbi:MAG: DUF11 domain-containing protein, partial [Chloroflexi bacterium]|nr:DUF11 domain-containing protein [Chloroflexota bacterium]